MNDKVKQIIVPFILMTIFDLGIFYLNHGQNFGEGFAPHDGILLIAGLLFGPYGALGAAIANLICDLIRGYTPIITVLSAVVGFGISCLTYKLWYGNYKGRPEVTSPKLNNTYNILLFIGITLFSGFLYSVLHGKLFYLLYPQIKVESYIIGYRYFFNFINSSFIFGIIGLRLSDRIGFISIPKTTQNISKEKFYNYLRLAFPIIIIAVVIIDAVFTLNKYIAIGEVIIIISIIFIYLTKPITANILVKKSKSIPEEIMNIFHMTVLVIIILGVLMSYDPILLTAVDYYLPISMNEIAISMMMLIDILLLIFLVPSLAVLKYIELKVIEPIQSFSRIEEYIHENEKIESDGLVNIYSKYINDETEIGTLARSYTDLITFNNNYIHPAKEVGGDFFDYYELNDDEVVIVIGDASGKGVPAAILAMITQVIVKQLIQTELDPSKVLYSLNNQLCEKNSESMFLTLWLGVYNKTTGKLTFSNAGHNPPLINEDGKFRYLNIDSGIVLGIMEDFDYINEEITLTDEIVVYTDGITDANNEENEMYGEDRLLNFFNEFKSDNDPIRPLLSDIHNFTKGAEQFDDMTLLYLKIK